MKNLKVSLNAGAIACATVAVTAWVGVKIATLVSTARAQKKLLHFIDNFTNDWYDKLKEIMELE